MKTNLFTLLCAALISSSCQPDNLPKVVDTKKVESLPVDPNTNMVHRLVYRGEKNNLREIDLIKVDGKEYIVVSSGNEIEICPK